MAYGSPTKQQSSDLVSQARHAGEETLATVGEYLGVRSRTAERRSFHDAWAFSSGLLLGGLIAAAVAVLVAPTDGQTLRRRLSAMLDEILGLAAPEPPVPEPVTEAAPTSDERSTGATETGTPELSPAPA